MRFAAITDTSGNLPTSMIKEAGLEIIAFPYFIDGREYTCLDTDSFHGDEFYARIKSGMKSPGSKRAWTWCLSVCPRASAAPATPPASAPR